MPRLSSFQIGDRIILKGASTDKLPALFIGGINEEGYYLLWKSQKDIADGKKWLHAAAGSHQAIAG
jgi:uncharacterized protein YbdZ (MbtH family)